MYGDHGSLDGLRVRNVRRRRRLQSTIENDDASDDLLWQQVSERRRTGHTGQKGHEGQPHDQAVVLPHLGHSILGGRENVVAQRPQCRLDDFVNRRDDG